MTAAGLRCGHYRAELDPETWATARDRVRELPAGTIDQPLFGDDA